MQIDPIKLTSKALAAKRLRLKCGELASNFAFNFNLRRYIEAEASTWLISDGILELSLLKRNRRGSYEAGPGAPRRCPTPRRTST